MPERQKELNYKLNLDTLVKSLKLVLILFMFKELESPDALYLDFQKRFLRFIQKTHNLNEVCLVTCVKYFNIRSLFVT